MYHNFLIDHDPLPELHNDTVVTDGIHEASVIARRGEASIVTGKVGDGMRVRGLNGLASSGVHKRSALVVVDADGVAVCCLKVRSVEAGGVLGIGLGRVGRSARHSADR